MNDCLKLKLLRYSNLNPNVEGIVAHPLGDVHFIRRFAPSEALLDIYRPMLLLVLQGAKQIMQGERVYELSAGQSLIVSIDTPIVGRVWQASRTSPYLAISIDVDMGLMREISSEIELSPKRGQEAIPNVFVDETDEAVLDCATRFVKLLDFPEAIPVLQSSIVRELHYWLLVGRHGNAIRQLAMPDSHTQRIARAVAVLRAEFMQPISIDKLAATAGMSPSSFYQHFKTITSLSPLQFQKRLRLLEARRLMVSDALNASQAAFGVGYESPSQFAREYARMFGAPPRRSIMQPSVAA